MNLKPVTIINARYSRYRQNTTQQLFLLKALRITQNPEELRKMIGVRTVADVFRTLDKLALRKEFHKSLAKNGIDFNYIVKGLAKEAADADKSADRIKVYQILLKSLGMEKYEDVSETGTQWEEALLKQIENDKKIKDKKESDTSKVIEGDYEVTLPQVPDSVKAMKDRDNDIGKSLYE